MFEEFTPAEAEAITGVSTTLQRDWRRRGYIAQAGSRKHNAFDLTSLAKLLVMRAFSEAGVFVGRAEVGASGSVYFVSAFVVKTLCKGSDHPRLANILAAKLPRFMVCVRGGSFAMVEKPDPLPREFEGELVRIVFDCKAAAKAIIARSPRPPVRFVSPEASLAGSTKDTPADVAEWANRYACVAELRSKARTERAECDG